MKRLAIVGGGVTKDKAPYSEDCVIWSTASVGLTLPRVDAIFELHGNVFSDDELNQAGCTLYVKENNDNLPKSYVFPIDRLIEKYGKHFNGTVVMMLGFAALQGYKHIELYGIDFSSDYEESMRSQFYYMMGLLSGQGYEIEVFPGGYMQSECYTYMYEDNGRSYLDDIKKRANDKIKEYEYNIMSMREGAAYMRGVVDTTAKIERRY